MGQYEAIHLSETQIDKILGTIQSYPTLHQTFATDEEWVTKVGDSQSPWELHRIARWAFLCSEPSSEALGVLDRILATIKHINGFEKVASKFRSPDHRQFWASWAEVWCSYLLAQSGGIVRELEPSLPGGGQADMRVEVDGVAWLVEVTAIGGTGRHDLWTHSELMDRLSFELQDVQSLYNIELRQDESTMFYTKEEIDSIVELCLEWLRDDGLYEQRWGCILLEQMTPSYHESAHVWIYATKKCYHQPITRTCAVLNRANPAAPRTVNLHRLVQDLAQTINHEAKQLSEDQPGLVGVDLLQGDSGYYTLDQDDRMNFPWDEVSHWVDAALLFWSGIGEPVHSRRLALVRPSSQVAQSSAAQRLFQRWTTAH